MSASVWDDVHVGHTSGSTGQLLRHLAVVSGVRSPTALIKDLPEPRVDEDHGRGEATVTNPRNP
jgi:hypothetical protein